MTANINYKQIYRFLISGGSAALVEMISFLTLTSFNSSIFIAHSVSFTLGFLVSFTLNRSWVFNNKANTLKQFFMYAILAIVNLCLSNMIILVLVHEMDLQPLVAKLAVMITIAVSNYVFFSKVIFKH